MTRMYRRILEDRISTIVKEKSVLLLGPRQVGKSTLLKGMKPDLNINLAREGEYLSHLKDPELIERSCKAIKKKRPVILVDEVQRIPSILNTIQSLIDDNPQYRFLLSGSSARKLNRGQANLLPGRVISEKMFPLTFWEMQENWSSGRLKKCLTHGSLPGLVDSDLATDILDSYADIYLREEIQAEALTKDLGDYIRFLDVAAEASGQYINYSKMASETEINKEKIRRFTQILQDTLLIHRLEAFETGPSKRKVRQKDRFLFFDNGVRNAILKKTKNQFTPTELGPLFETWIIQQIMAFISYYQKPWKISSYRDDQNLEVDLIIETGKKVYAIEIKFQNRYRQDFGENLTEFTNLYSGRSPHQKFSKIVLYLGEQPQITQDQTEILPYAEFLRDLKDL